MGKKLKPPFKTKFTSGWNKFDDIDDDVINFILIRIRCVNLRIDNRWTNRRTLGNESSERQNTYEGKVRTLKTVTPDFICEIKKKWKNNPGTMELFKIFLPEFEDQPVEDITLEKDAAKKEKRKIIKKKI
jgi:hypothetical protein